ncbi:unnamed protein product [Nesidiocoris tenuis]|uniref:Uncharacterized protein n=1 Tax=Nesidiocoris tenuis TaxID=355587 RepID=A0A6H5GF94_9HEMI|nr:unnamed protein product [Nesidiocoris tenuis]
MEISCFPENQACLAHLARRILPAVPLDITHPTYPFFSIHYSHTFLASQPRFLVPNTLYPKDDHRSTASI